MARQSDILTIKVLSVRQPWASLIVMGYKDVENRTWTTSYRGTIYIHAGRKFEHGAMSNLEEYGDELFGDDADRVLRLLPEQPRGALIGCVTLRDILPFDEDNADELSIWHLEDNFGWYLTDPKILRTPIPMNGKLGLFHLEVEKDAIVTARRRNP